MWIYGSSETRIWSLIKFAGNVIHQAPLFYNAWVLQSGKILGITSYIIEPYGEELKDLILTLVDVGIFLHLWK